MAVIGWSPVFSVHILKIKEKRKRNELQNLELLKMTN